jgi:hypothetical protein
MNGRLIHTTANTRPEETLLLVRSDRLIRRERKAIVTIDSSAPGHVQLLVRSQRLFLCKASILSLSPVPSKETLAAVPACTYGDQAIVFSLVALLPLLTSCFLPLYMAGINKTIHKDHLVRAPPFRWYPPEPTHRDDTRRTTDKRWRLVATTVTYTPSAFSLLF